MICWALMLSRAIYASGLYNQTDQKFQRYAFLNNRFGREARWNIFFERSDEITYRALPLKRSEVIKWHKGNCIYWFVYFKSSKKLTEFLRWLTLFYLSNKRVIVEEKKCKALKRDKVNNYRRDWCWNEKGDMDSLIFFR